MTEINTTIALVVDDDIKLLWNQLPRRQLSDLVVPFSSDMQEIPSGNPNLVKEDDYIEARKGCKP